jgi:hypothetical protein
MSNELMKELMGLNNLSAFQTHSSFSSRRAMFPSHLGKPFGAEAAADAEQIAANLCEKGNEQNPPDSDSDDRSPCSS